MQDTEGYTVIITGAGASKPYGFPLGPELIDEVYTISNFLDGNQ